MSLEVRNDETHRKFYATLEGHEAEIEYAKTGDSYNLLHTFVPEELRGHHVGEDLVRGALDLIKQEGATFLPTCPFVQVFLKRYPEYQAGVGAPHTSRS